MVRAALDRLVAASIRQRASLAVLLGLQRTDVYALERIARGDDITPTALARVLSLSSGGTSAVVDRLVDAGLVTRAPYAGGRRRVALGLTAHGAAVMDARRAPLAAEVAGLVAGLTTEQREHLERSVGHLADIAERHADRLAADAVAVAAEPLGVGAPMVWG